MHRFVWPIALGLVACGDNQGVAPDASHTTPPQPDSATMPDPDSPTPPADAPPTPGLMLSYSFEDTGISVLDSSGRGMTGTLSDPSSWTANGRVGRGISLSGATPAAQYVSLPDGVLSGVDDFTIAVWVKLDTNAAWARIYDIGNGLADPANRFMYLTTSGYSNGQPDGVHASSYGGSATDEAIASTGTALPTGVWKHLTVTGSGGERSLYIDGFLAGTLHDGPVVPPSANEPIAGNSWLGKSRFPDPGLGGTLDELRVYDHVLAPAEIADLAWPQHDYAYWRFDEGTGATARDSSDFAIPTTLSDGATWTPNGRSGAALQLTGGAAGATGPHVELGANPLAGCTTQLTVAAWVNLRALTPWSRIFDFGTGNTAFIYLAPTDGAGTHFAMVAPTGLFDMVTAGPAIPADSAWHHVAVTIDTAGLVTLFADGAPVATQTSPSVKPSDFANVTENWLGKSRFPDPYLNGSIDDLRVSCRAYTGDEIKNLAHPVR